MAQVKVGGEFSFCEAERILEATCTSVLYNTERYFTTMNMNWYIHIIQCMISPLSKPPIDLYH